MEDLRRQIEQLADREAIRQLVARYCHYVRTRNFEGMVELYAPDGTWESNMSKGGRHLARTYWTSLKQTDELDPWPFTHNHLIELAGEGRASGYVYVEFRMGSQD